MKNFIKVEGKIKPYKFMNALVNKIKENNECSIKTDNKTYKFLVDFEMKKEENEDKIPEELLKELNALENEEKVDNEEEEDDYEDERVKNNNSSIQVKLFESYNSGYIVRFMKKSGGMDNFYKNVNKIKEAIKKII